MKAGSLDIKGCVYFMFYPLIFLSLFFFIIFLRDIKFHQLEEMYKLVNEQPDHTKQLNCKHHS